MCAAQMCRLKADWGLNAAKIEASNERFHLKRKKVFPNGFSTGNAIASSLPDGVQKANLGYPGAPMGMADTAEVLWTEFFKPQPRQPQIL